MIYSCLRPPPSNLCLPTGEIHVWAAHLDQMQNTANRFVKMLSRDEQSRAAQFHFERDKSRFTIRRGILRAILGAYLRKQPHLLEFSHGKNGKPTLAHTFGNERICFNLSHSAGTAIYVFIRGREIGVDIEKIRDISGTEHVAEQFFSHREYEILCSLPDNEKKEAFFNCWTRKEAFLKATGEGLSRRLSTFDVSFVPGQPAGLLRVEGNFDAPSHWSIKDLEPAFGFAAALAVEGRSWQLHCWQWLL
jgi:4'-phosphopantetheinyl transferase